MKTSTCIRIGDFAFPIAFSSIFFTEQIKRDY